MSKCASRFSPCREQRGVRLQAICARKVAINSDSLSLQRAAADTHSRKAWSRSHTIPNATASGRIGIVLLFSCFFLLPAFHLPSISYLFSLAGSLDARMCTVRFIQTRESVEWFEMPTVPAAFSLIFSPFSLFFPFNPMNFMLLPLLSQMEDALDKRDNAVTMRKNFLFNVTSCV